MTLQPSIDRIKKHIRHHQTFPWMRNWKVAGGICESNGTSAAWIPTLFAGDLSSGNVLEAGEVDTYSVDGRGEVVPFKKFRLTLAASPMHDSTPQFPIKTNQLPTLQPLEDGCSLYARKCLAVFRGSPLSIAIQVHFLSMVLRFSNFFILHDDLVRAIWPELDPNRLANAIRDATVRVTEILDVDLETITGSLENPQSLLSILGT